MASPSSLACSWARPPSFPTCAVRMADSFPNVADRDLTLHSRPDTEDVEPETPEAGVSLKKRLLNPKTILSFVVGILLLVTVFRRLGDFSEAAQTIRGVNVGIYLLAFVA